MSPTVSCPVFQELYVFIFVSYGPISMFLRNGWRWEEVSNTHTHTNNSHEHPSLKNDFITITHAKRIFHMILSSLTKGERKLQRHVCMHGKATISLLHGIIVSYHLTHTNTCTWPYHSLQEGGKEVWDQIQRPWLSLSLSLHTWTHAHHAQDKKETPSIYLN